MNMNDELAALVSKVQQLLAMLKPLERTGDRKATLFADGVRRRLDALRNAMASGDADRLTSILLDIVPSAKDLDSIGFRIDLYPDMRALANDIGGTAAEIAKPLIDTP
jgi:hypothetical protein